LMKVPEPMIVFNNLTDTALEMNASFWVDVTKNDPAYAKDMVLLKVKPALEDKEG
jgi:small-conductance mechanosensitive channel